MPYEQAQHRPGGIGDPRLRDLADMTVDATRSFLQGALAFLGGLARLAGTQKPRWVDDRQPRQAETYDAPSGFDIPRHLEERQGW
ncbi:hypothetical protein [Microvirga roseola]|uniref:hypothetical protein n=1 Tax=Microvirga roseola TaxID=2883126 RepID=UPI001E4F385A|nr:hypothetical protein [Microvirga roseola]